MKTLSLFLCAFLLIACNQSKETTSMNTCPKIADYTYPPLDPEADKIFKKARALQKQVEPYKDGHHQEIVALYTQAANKGHYKAMNNLGILYGVGAFIPEDESQALALYKKMEKIGVPEGFINMASAYKDGLADISPNKKKYKAYLKKAAETGHPRGQFLYGELLYYPNTIKDAKYWLDCALQQNYADAAFSLANYEKNFGTEAEAFQYYRKGAMLGSSMCLSELVDTYRYGAYGIESDINHSRCLYSLQNKLRSDPSLTFPDLDDLCPPSK